MVVSVPTEPSRQEFGCEAGELVQPARGRIFDHRILSFAEIGLEDPLRSPLESVLGEHDLPETIERRAHRGSIERDLVEGPPVVDLRAGLGQQEVLDPIRARPPVRLRRSIHPMHQGVRPSADSRSVRDKSSSHVAGIA